MNRVEDEASKANSVDARDRGNEPRPTGAGAQAHVGAMKDFVSGRLARIEAGETPVPLASGARVVVHVVPAASLGDEPALIDFAPLDGGAASALTTGRGAGGALYCYDGLAAFDGDDPRGRGGYALAFRTGAFEAVSTLAEGVAGRGLFPAYEVEQCLRRGIEAYLTYARDQRIAAPIAVVLTAQGFGACQRYGDLTGSEDRRLPIGAATLSYPPATLRDAKGGSGGGKGDASGGAGRGAAGGEKGASVKDRDAATTDETAATKHEKGGAANEPKGTKDANDDQGSWHSKEALDGSLAALADAIWQTAGYPNKRA